MTRLLTTGMARSKHTMTLLLDWDGTIATTDTLSLIASIGYEKNSRSPSPRSLPPWSHFSQSYMADYAAHKSSYKPDVSSRKTIEDELAWLESVTLVERESVERVEAAGIFKDVTDDDIVQTAVQAVAQQKVALRKGLGVLLDRVILAGGHVKVVSVNWSGRFIGEYLKQVGADPKNRIHGLEWPDIRVNANDIVPGSGGRLTRYFGDRGIWTVADKRRVLDDVLQDVGSKRGTVYVGDSLTDLQCLLDVDVGICVRDEKMGSEQRGLKEALERLGVLCKWIGDYGVESTDNEPRATMSPKILWWARDFDEIAKSPVFQKSH